MRITPLVQHACARIPQLTDVFSDVVTANIIATPDSTTDINCDAPHGQEIGSKIAVCVRKAKMQIAITNAVFKDNNNVELTFNGPHGLVDNTNSIVNQSYNPTIELMGFVDPLMNGEQEFLYKIDSSCCVIKAPDDATLDLSPNAAMLDERNDYFNGWHPVDVIGPNTFRMPTNAALRSITNASNVSIALNIRACGTLGYDDVKEYYTGDQSLRDVTLSIHPIGVVSVSKDRGAKSSATSELNNNTVLRQMMLDGFHVVATVPTGETRGALQAIDLCHGEILNAVIKTFQGYRSSLPDLEGVDSYASILKQHGGMSFDRAFYAHEYQFETPYQFNNLNALSATEQTAAAQIETLDPSEVGSAQPIGSVPLSDLQFDGVLNGDLSQPLTASVKYEDNT